MDMTQNSDGTVSFKYTTKQAMKPDKPEEALLYDSFDNCSGIGGNDGLWEGANIGNGDFIPDTDGWTGTPKSGANKCALFGNATRKANVATPTFNITEPCIISLLAAPYSDNSENKLTLAANYGSDATLAETEFTLTPRQWTEIKTSLTGNGDVSLRIKTNTKGVFIDNICVLPQEYAGIDITDNTQAKKASESIYTIDGRCIKTSRNELPKGIYIINGKKMIK